MKNIYVQYQNGIPISVNSYIAEYGFKRMGRTVSHFTREEVETWTENECKLLKNNTFVGGCATMLKIVDLMGVKRPLTYNPHIYLPNYCGRDMFITTLAEARNTIVKSDKPFFIKPAADTKIFDGYVVRVQADFLRLRHLDGNLPVLISDVIQIDSEFRCFVHKRKLVDVKNYTDITPTSEFVGF